MSLDKSLKSSGRLARSRNVLKREERIAKLEEEGRWQEGDSPFGLPLVRVLKVRAGKKKKDVKDEEGDPEAEGTEEVEAPS